MKQIIDAVEVIRKMRERVKDSAFLSTEELNAFIPLLDLAEKVLAVEGTMPEKKTNPYDNKLGDSISPDDDFWDDQGQNSCLLLGYNKAIDDCRMAITGALLSEEEIQKILNQSWLDDYGDHKHPYAWEIAYAIHSAQMEKLGGE